ncbi:MAG: baseplate J/gp47 family protein [Labilithrix sp.]|nr:baseplate J/gp47 family protein [Labilithrix sp.]
MPTIPIEVLVRPVSADDVYEASLRVLERVKIPARSWRPGGVARTLLSTLCEVGAQGASVVTSGIGGMFLAFAKKAWLTAHAKDVYDVDRIEATFATGRVKLTNNGPLSHTIGPDELVVRSSTTRARFRVTEGFVLGAGSSVEVSVSAIEAGSGSSVAPGEIDEFETPLQRVTVTNPASILGRDDESDDQLVRRCLTKKGTWSPFGPRDAYEHAALSARMPDGSPTTITRVSVSRWSSTGRVTVVCATPNGAPSADELAAVRAEIGRRALTGGARLTLLGARPKAMAKTIRIWAHGGVEATLRSQASAALATMFDDFPIGGIPKADGGPGYVYDDKIAAAVIGSSVEIFDIDIIAGAGDVLLDRDEVPVNTTTFEVRVR